ncbi:ComEC/Rec2 family competence protein [Pseudalkalibacillus hwajinpoensis]|uniref:ComEC/Rec2 family competence protein n=1 Tax=Guptibacillus hwajinpoensis TaxID=208199 RepID=UPI00325ACFDF
MRYAAILFSSLIILLHMPYDVTAQANEAEIHFIDVGQADSILVTHEGKTMLIDAGDNGDGGAVSTYLKKLGIHQLDYVVATHPHHDHIGGMDTVLKKFEVEKVVMPDVSYPTGHYKALMKVIKKKGISIMTAQKGKKLKLGQQMSVKILSPTKHAEYEDFNDYSAVLQIRHEENTFLLMGDAGIEIEKQLLAGLKEKKMKSDVLKIGHHGANSATTDAFLKAVDPETAVISVGRNNRYHFPDGLVLQRLKGLNISILRTDQDGTVVAKSDGKQIVFLEENKIHPQKKEK